MNCAAACQPLKVIPETCPGCEGGAESRSRLRDALAEGQHSPAWSRPPTRPHSGLLMNHSLCFSCGSHALRLPTPFTHQCLRKVLPFLSVTTVVRRETGCFLCTVGCSVCLTLTQRGAYTPMSCGPSRPLAHRTGSFP